MRVSENGGELRKNREELRTALEIGDDFEAVLKSLDEGIIEAREETARTEIHGQKANRTGEDL